MATFSLQIQGVSILRSLIGDTVRITETANGSNPVMTWTMKDTAETYSHAWLGKLSQDVAFLDLTDSRRLFKGNLVNVRRRQVGKTTRFYECTAIGYNAWLDRLVIPKWVSKRPNGTAITSDREMIGTVATALANTPTGNFAFDTINTYVSETNTSMPVVTMKSGGTVGEILQAIAESAATNADPTPRRFYIDLENHLHYFKGTESLSAPYYVGDATYTTTVTDTTGLVSFWKLDEAAGATASDTEAYATATLNGGYTRNVTPIVPNSRALPSTTLNGSTGYATASGASLHQADGPWSVEFWVQRGAIGSQQAVWSGGATDILIGFDANNKVRVQKEGTGDHFVSGAAYASMTAPYHVVVTRTGGAATKVYVNGFDVTSAGTTTARTFASAAGAINIGRKLSTTDQFLNGTIQHVSFYSAALSAATVLEHYNDGWTITPFEFEFETDVNSSGTAVYLKGTQGSGWFYLPGNSNYNGSSMLDTGQALTAAKRTAIGTAYLKGEAAPLHGGRFKIANVDGWRANQTVTINDEALGIDGSDSNITTTYQIRQVDTTFELGAGRRMYDIYFGLLPWSGTFDIQRKKRRGAA